MSYTYYDNDQVQSVSDARGMVTTYSYNTRRLVTGVSYNDGGATPSVSYSYDEWGARSQMVDGMGTTSYSYNGMRQMQSETRTLVGLPGESYTLGYSYNLAGQVKQVSYTATNFSKQINYAYTSAGALSGVGTNLIGTDPNATSNVVSLTGYLAWGATTSATYGNGRTLAMGYSEQRHQLTSMIVQKSDGSDRIVDKSYEYYDTNQANTGRLMKQTDHLDPAYSVTYYYDGVNRLYSAQAGSFDTVKGYDRTYSYDEWGNVRSVSGDSDGTQATQFSTTYNYTVNGTGAPATNRLTDVNGVPYTYDAAGNLTSDGLLSYTYDAANRLKTSNGGQCLYYYDGDGHRVRRDFPGVTPLFYVWSSVLGNVAMEVRPQTVVRAYVYAGSSPVALQNWDGTFVWIHKDHLGSTSLLTKTDGSVACKTQFDPSGQQVMLWVNPVGGTSISQGFTGYEKDNPTGLYNAQARMYSYGQARFLQPDPLGVGAANPAKPQSFNRYSYVDNDPVNFTDPEGLIKCGDLPVSGGGTVGSRVNENSDTGKLIRLVWHEGGPLSDYDNLPGLLRVSQELIAQAVLNRLAIANGRVAVVGKDLNIYWGNGGNGTLPASILGYGSLGTTLSQEIVRAAAGTTAVDSSGEITNRNVLNSVLNTELGDPTRDLPGRFPLTLEDGTDIYVTAECYAAISAMQSTNTILANPTLYNQSGFFVTSWKRFNSSNPDSDRLYDFGVIGGAQGGGLGSLVLGPTSMFFTHIRVQVGVRVGVRRLRLLEAVPLSALYCEVLS